MNAASFAIGWNGTIEDYVTSGMGGESIIMIKNNGKYEVIKD